MFLILFCYDDRAGLWADRYAFGGVFVLDSGCERTANGVAFCACGTLFLQMSYFFSIFAG